MYVCMYVTYVCNVCCVCLYVCIHVYMYVCIHVDVCLCMHACILPMHACMRVHVYISVYIHTHTIQMHMTVPPGHLESRSSTAISKTSHPINTIQDIIFSSRYWARTSKVRKCEMFCFHFCGVCRTIAREERLWTACARPMRSCRHTKARNSCT
jgi:hypothetical protein